jgi:choline kinase
MVCVILAAGKNLRLNLGQPKSALTVGGQSLMERHIDQFLQIGVSKFAVITGFHQPALDEICGEIGKKYNTEITTIYNEKYELENGYSLYAAKDWIHELGDNEFFFTMADHYYEKSFLSELKSKIIFDKDAILKLAVDIPDTHNEHIDLDDVTKVDADDYILRIGKEITGYNYYDTGLFYVKKDVFDVLDEIAADQKLSISNLVTTLAERKKARIVEVVGHYWNDIDTPEDFASSRAHLDKKITGTD